MATGLRPGAEGDDGRAVSTSAFLLQAYHGEALTDDRVQVGCRSAREAAAVTRRGDAIYKTGLP